MNTPPLNEVLSQINNIIEEYFDIRSDDSKIFQMHTLAEDLARYNLFLSYHYRNQENNYALAKVSYYDNFNSRKRELMNMPSFEGKKMSAAYATMVAEEQFFNYKKDYVLAEAEKEGIKSISFQIKENLEGIRQRIASIKNNNV